MNIATTRFTISTMTVAACAMVALATTEPAQAQSAAPAVQRIEIIGQRLVPVQRIVIVGQRVRAERVATVAPKTPRL